MEEIAMRAKRHVAVVAGFLGQCAIAVGIVTHAGCLIIRDPKQAALSGARAGIHGELERPEAFVPMGRIQSAGVWAIHILLLGTELVRGQVDVAVRVWHDAYGAALQSRSWEGMIAVGDASMRIGHAAGTPGSARLNARDAYMIALIRARRSSSLELLSSALASVRPAV
jgi:hypothetical protein